MERTRMGMMDCDIFKVDAVAKTTTLHCVKIVLSGEVNGVGKWRGG